MSSFNLRRIFVRHFNCPSSIFWRPFSPFKALNYSTLSTLKFQMALVLLCSPLNLSHLSWYKCILLLLMCSSVLLLSFSFFALLRIITFSFAWLLFILNYDHFVCQWQHFYSFVTFWVSKRQSFADWLSWASLPYTLIIHIFSKSSRWISASFK